VRNEEQHVVAAQEEALDREEIAGDDARVWVPKTRITDLRGGPLTVAI
jgi:hypothetical protein